MASKNKVLKLVHPARTDWLDDEAKALLRQGAMRLLREVAGVDSDGTELEMDPRRSKEAILALSLLFDKVPDVLRFEARSKGEFEGETGEVRTIDLLSPEGRDTITDALRSLPEEMLKLAVNGNE